MANRINILLIIGVLAILKSLYGMYVLLPFGDESVEEIAKILEWNFELFTLILGICFLRTKISELKYIFLDNLIFFVLLLTVLLFAIKSFYEYGFSQVGIIFISLGLFGAIVGIIGRVSIKRSY